MARNTTASIDAKEKYGAKSYDRVHLLLPKGRRDFIRQYLDAAPDIAHGHTYDKAGSINRFINLILAKTFGLSPIEWGLKAAADDGPAAERVVSSTCLPEDMKTSLLEDMSTEQIVSEALASDRGRSLLHECIRCAYERGKADAQLTPPYADSGI